MSRAAPATAPQTQTAEPQQQRPDEDFARLMSKNARIGGLYKTLSAADHNIEAMLPDFMKGQGDRLIRRACITFSKTPSLQNISDEDYRRCVIEAAEMGFAIDGRLCYVVNYAGKSASTYQVQLDYKAMVAVAKRCRTIKDIDTDVVRDGDHFKHGRYGGTNLLEHTFDVRSLDRGEVVAAYCRVFLPDGTWNYEVMTRSQLDAIQRRAPAQNGPWKTDTDEMRRKTVLRRKLKLYQDDPGLMRMLEITDAGLDDDDAEDNRPHTVAALNQTLTSQKPRPEPTRTNGHAEPEDAGAVTGTVQTEEDAAPDDDQLTYAREGIAAAKDATGVDFERDQCFAKWPDISPATRAAIEAMAAERKAALAAPKGKAKQGELVK